MSQSLFATSFVFFNSDGSPGSPRGGDWSPPTSAKVAETGYEVSQIGYSSIAVIFSIVVGGLLILTGWIDDLRRYPAGMPHVGTCSAAISAACHAEKDADAREQMVLKPLQWGVVGDEGKSIMHCTFTDDVHNVRLPDEEDLCR